MIRSAIIAAAFAFSLEANAQSIFHFGDDAPERSLLPLTLLLPHEFRNGYFIRDIIRSDAFGRYDSTHDAGVVFDDIYYTSVALNHGDLQSTFFATAFGSLEHEYLPIDLLGAKIDLPLTSETHEQFLTRQAHIPKHLYQTPEDDRDKLQHFFASAWLKSWLGMDCLVSLGGELVEFFESMFVEGSTRDPRDIHANKDGAHFAIKAARNLSEPPSRSLTNNP